MKAANKALHRAGTLDPWGQEYLPGGSVKFGASGEVACHRKVREETRLTIAFSGTYKHG